MTGGGSWGEGEPGHAAAETAEAQAAELCPSTTQHHWPNHLRRRKPRGEVGPGLNTLTQQRPVQQGVGVRRRLTAARDEHQLEVLGP